MAGRRKRHRVWTVEVRETRDWTVTVHEDDLDLPRDASDQDVEEAVAARADKRVADRHPSAIDDEATTRAVGHVELQT
jgi:hypothetical protein